METTAALTITTRRQELGWSVRRLARESGLSPALISLVESGKRPLTAPAAGRIARALGFPARDLLAVAGFIPEADLELAREQAKRALAVPDLAAQARGTSDEERLDWLTDDYLLRLGHSPSGNDGDASPNSHFANWQLLDPNEPASELLDEMARWLHDRSTAAAPPIPIEGWDELSRADQQFVQQLVNKLRRRTSDE